MPRMVKTGKRTYKGRMQDSLLFTFWAQLHVLGKSFFIGLSLALCALRPQLLGFREEYEKYLRSFALGAQVAFLFWPLFPMCIIRGRVDMALWLMVPLLWGLGNLGHFVVYSFSKVRLPLRDFSASALLGLLLVPWQPLTTSYWQSAQVFWGILALVFLLSCEGNFRQSFFGLTLIAFFFSLFGFLLPHLAPLLFVFLLGIWTYGLFREMLVLFSFFPEGNKRYFPALIAFVLTMAAGLAWA